MANDGSLGGNVTSNSFDLNSQKGVANLLASVRASSVSRAQKNEIRDLIFQYMNGGMDNSVRISLEHKLASSNIALVVPPTKVLEKSTPVIQYPFGTSRPSPTFPVSNSVTSAKPAPEKASVKPQIQEPVEIVTPKLVVATPSPIPKREPSQVEPEPVAILTPSVPVVEPTPEPEPLMDPSQGLQRIKEIKSIVNEKIGNPVNLVDINNEVGREYMSAMLDAMKKLNTGSSAVSAMKRLEDAYLMVEKTLSEHQNKQDVAEDVSEAPQVETPQETVSIPVTPTPEIIPKNEPVAVPATGFVETTGFDTVENESVQEPVKSEWSAPVPEKSREESQPINKGQSTWGSENETLQVPDGKAHSLAEANIKLRKPEDLPLSSAIETSSVSGDPLFTKEVDEGLQQLLSEWPIFKKSGFFGTGPNGREHPLFIKVSTLQIPLLLAGRFEGATQEIKQSITDYMNGWRYEQGIIYEHGENFEHYLRRVIRHIIDLQNRKRTS